MNHPTSVEPKRHGLSRVLHAFFYSVEGLRAGWHEPAFRQEAILAVLILPGAWWLGQSWAEVVFVFYESGKVLVGSLEDLAKHKFDAGVYQYKAQKQELQMQINGETLLFRLSIDDHEGLWLKTKKGKNISKFLHLVPLTEPQTP